MPSGHSLSYDPVPGVNPSGAPGGDYETIQARPEMFGSLVGHATEGLGQSIEKASDVGYAARVEAQQLDDKTHGAELHSWFSDKATDLSEAFMQHKGRAALDALPQYKQDLQQLFSDAKSQAGNRDTENILQSETRRQMDYFYQGGARHAAGQQSVWQATTAKNAAASYGNTAVLAASQGDFKTADDFLFNSDQETRNHQESLGFEGPALQAEVQKNRGTNVKNIVEQIANAEGPGGGMSSASKWYMGQRDKIDAGSRVQIENYLKGGLAKIAGEKIADDIVGRSTTAKTPVDIASRFVGANERDQREVLSQFIGRIGGKTVDPSTTAWCAGFVNAVLREAGVPGSGSLMARSFLNVGTPVDGEPKPGDIVVLSRGDPSSGQGHVGFYVGPGSTPGSVKILAGNQNDAVGYGEYPGERVLGVRRVTAGDIGSSPYVDSLANRPLVNKGDAMLRIMDQYGDRPQVQAAALSHLNKVYEAYHLQQVQDSAGFKVRIQDSTAEALTNGSVQNPISQEEFVRALGPAEGPAKFAEYQANVEFGATLRSVAGLSPAELGELRERNAPKPGDGFLAQSKRAEALDKAIGENFSARDKDPAGYIVSRTDGGQAAWKSFQKLGADPHATPAMRSQYAAIYAEQMRALETHAGVDPKDVTFLPKSHADGLAARWRAPSAIPPANGQPGGAQMVLNEINQQAGLWGDNWPKVYSEIAPKLDPTLRVVAAGVSPVAGMTLLNAQSVKEGAVFGEQDAATKQVFGAAVTEALRPFFATISGSEQDQTRKDYEETTKKLAALYLTHGTAKDASTAATQAVSDILAFKYDFRGSMRIPKLDVQGAPQPFTGEQIEAGSAAAKDALGQPFASNLDAANREMKLTPQERALYERHLTNLTGPGGVDNPNGSRSTLFQMSVERDGKTYNVPTVWDGKILPPAEAMQRAEKEGLNKFPSYASEAEAERRYQQMHTFMDKDVQRFRENPPLDIAIAGATPGLSDKYARDATVSALVRDGIWMTSSGETGLKLVMPDGRAWPSRSDPGRPFVLTWDQLTRLGGDRRAYNQQLLERHGAAAGGGL